MFSPVPYLYTQKPALSVNHFFIIIPTINPLVILSEFTVVSNLKPYCPWGGGGEGGKHSLRVTPYNGIYREALHKRGTF